MSNAASMRNKGSRSNSVSVAASGKSRSLACLRASLRSLFLDRGMVPSSPFPWSWSSSLSNVVAAVDIRAGFTAAE